MDSPNDKPLPEETPPAISDEEVERLLEQAQNLANDLVEDVGVDSSKLRATLSATGELGGPEPDPLGAVELVALDVDQLRGTLQEMEANVPTETPEPLPLEVAPQPAESPDPLAPEVAQASEEAPEVSMPESLEMDSTVAAAVSADPVIVAPAPVEQEPVEAAPIAEAPSDSEASTPPSVEESTEPGSAQKIETVDHTIERPAPAAAEPVAAPLPVAQSEQPPPTTPPVAPVVSNHKIKNSLKRCLSGSVRVVRTVAVSVPNTFLRCIILIDKPFSRIPSAAKTAMGLIGVVSMLMGVAAMLLPKMMQHNPYALMEPQPHHEEPAEGGEHGGEKTEHAPAEKSEHGGGHGGGEEKHEEPKGHH